MRKRLKNFILKTITWIAIFTWIFSAMAFDSDNYIIPVFVNVISGAWLCLFFYANQFYFWKWERGEV